MSHLNATPEERLKIKEIIDDMKFVMMITKNQEGCLHSRPMGTIKTADNLRCLWFFTSFNSAKTYDISRDEHVNLSYANPDVNTYLSICGTAKIVRDQAKINELWTPEVAVWFPKGKEDPQVCLIEVIPTEVQYWIYPDSKISQAVEFVKKLTIGEFAELGKHNVLGLI